MSAPEARAVSYRDLYAAALRAWRMGKGMTQSQLAAWLAEREGGRAPSEQTICQWELGYRLPCRKWQPMLQRAGFVPPARQAPPVIGRRRYA
jgi:transcriptional regulator with XRE-family HTH domain